MGDAVLAVFGVPRAHEDDAERAVRAALEMQAVLSELNRGFAAEGKPTLEMRIGIEAGEVLVDLERASGPRDRMLTGDAVNTAARLQTAGRTGPDRRRGRPSTRATKDVIEYRELEPLALKGKAEPVPAWQALRIKARTRGERPRLGLEARLVGRDEELAVLKQTLRRVETEGRPALVTVVGPAGVGKSRLVAELERYVEGLPADRVLAPRPVPRVREHVVLGVRRRDQGAVRDLRGRRGRGRGRRRRTPPSRELFGDDERGAADPRARRRRRGPRREPRGPVRGLAAVPRAAGGALPARARARRHPLGRRRAARLRRARRRLGAGTDPRRSRPPVPSCSRRARRGAAASATPRRSTSTRSRRPRARRCSTTSSRARSRPSSSARSSSAARATRSYVEEIVRKLIDDGVLRATEALEVGGGAAGRGRGAPALDPGADRRAPGRPARGREGRAPGRGGRRPRVLGRRGRRARGPSAARGPRRARPAAREGARRAARALVVLRRARVLVPPQPDPRRRVRLAAEGAPRRQARRRRALGRAIGPATAPTRSPS